MNFSPKKISTSAGDVAVYQSRGSGPTVFMIHGNSLSSNIFANLINGPFGDTFRAFAIDLPGHGHSQDARMPEQDYTLPGYARVVRDLVQQLVQGPLVLFGSSLGGHVALEYLAAFDDEISGIAIMGAPPIGYPPEDMATAFLPSPAIDFLFKETLSDEEILAFASLISGCSIEDVPKTLIDDAKRTDGRARAMLGASVQRGEYVNEADLVANSVVPFMMLHAEKDPLINVEYLERLTFGNLFQNEIKIIEGAEHVVSGQHLADLEARLSEFIRYVT